LVTRKAEINPGFLREHLIFSLSLKYRLKCTLKVNVSRGFLYAHRKKGRKGDIFYIGQILLLQTFHFKYMIVPSIKIFLV